MISLIDENRQWFKSRVGTNLTETPLELSFCKYALSRQDLLIVPDARLDSRFAGKPLVTGEPGICSYAGGSLCVIDLVPKELTAQQELALRVLSRQVMTHIESRRQQRELKASEGKLRAIIEAEPECVKILGIEGTLLEMNKAGLRIIEADSVEAVPERNIMPMVVPEDRTTVRAMLAAVAGGEKRVVDFQIVGLAGTPHSIEMTGVPFHDVGTGEELVLAISRDVTQRKLVEFRLHRLNRLHAVLSKTGEAVLRGRDRLGLYDAVCRIAVDDGRRRMAIIVEVDTETGFVPLLSIAVSYA